MAAKDVKERQRRPTRTPLPSRPSRPSNARAGQRSMRTAQQALSRYLRTQDSPFSQDENIVSIDVVPLEGGATEDGGIEIKVGVLDPELSPHLGSTVHIGTETYPVRTVVREIDPQIESWRASLVKDALEASDVAERPDLHTELETVAKSELVRLSATLSAELSQLEEIETTTSSLFRKSVALEDGSIALGWLFAVTSVLSAYIWHDERLEDVVGWLPVVGWIPVALARALFFISIAGVVVAVATYFYSQLVNNRWWQHYERREGLESELRARALASVEIKVRQRLNGILEQEGADGDQTSLVTLYTNNAPALVELEQPDGIQHSESMSEVEDLIGEHDTMAIGLAGPRGIGKSTIMRQMAETADEGTLGVYVPVPVLYGPTEFLRVLFAKTAEAVLDSQERGPYAPVREMSIRWPARVFRLTPAWSILLIYGGIMLVFFHEGLRSFGVVRAVGVGLIAVGLILYWAWASDQRMRRRRYARQVADTSALVEESRRVLDRLRWSRTVSTSTNLGVEISPVTASQEHGEEATERDLVHAELVADYRKYLERISTEWRRIIIAIDELDKIDDAVTALSFVSNMKDLFHVRRTYFLVSVSEEALQQYALRGLVLRDAFDSSFDTVIEVQRLKANASIGLLRARAVAFPLPAVLLCHAMSGGLPRDLIRYARECVQIRRSCGPVQLRTLTERVICDELRRVTRSAAVRARLANHQALARFLSQIECSAREADGSGTMLLTSTDDAPSPLEDQLAMAAEKVQRALDEAPSVPIGQRSSISADMPNHVSVPMLESDAGDIAALLRLPSFLRFLREILVFFGRGPDNQWPRLIESGEGLRRADELAAMRAGLETE